MKVLFVCVHNAGRSQMAEAFFNRLAGGRGQALSAGTEPSSSVGPTIVDAMREVGIDISGSDPKALTEELVAQADRIITMGCDVEESCPAGFVASEDWELEDPKDKSLKTVREIRDEIRNRVMELLAESGR